MIEGEIDGNPIDIVLHLSTKLEPRYRGIHTVSEDLSRDNMYLTQWRTKYMTISSIWQDIIKNGVQHLRFDCKDDLEYVQSIVEVLRLIDALLEIKETHL